MKTLVIIASMLTIPVSFTLAQQLERQVIGSSGTSVQSTSLDVSFTVGECLAGTRSAEAIIITEGFQQSTSDDAITGLGMEEAVQRITFFPNPMKDQLQVRIKTERGEDFIPTLFDLTGKKLVEQKIFLLDNGHANYLLDVSNLRQGAYILIVQPEFSGARIGFKVVK